MNMGLFASISLRKRLVNLDKDIKTQRPFTHDLFKSFAYRFDIAIKRVIINKLVDGVFYSSLICERDKIEEIIDSRTSDAVSLALRFKAPIYTHESVLDKAGVVFEKGELPTQGTLGDELSDEINYTDLSNQEIENAIKKAVKKEDYELAARLRDEISKRSNKTKE